MRIKKKPQGQDCQIPGVYALDRIVLLNVGTQNAQLHDRSNLEQQLKDTKKVGPIFVTKNEKNSN